MRPVVPDLAGTGITGLIEKPDPENAPSNLAIVPRYVFSPSIFDTIDATPRGKDGERWLTDAIAILAREMAPVRVVPLEEPETRYDIGNFASYYRAFIDFALSDHEYSDAVSRHIRCLVDSE